MDRLGTQLLKIRGDTINTNTAFRCYGILLLVMVGVFFIISVQAPHSLVEFEVNKNCDVQVIGENQPIGYCNHLDLLSGPTWTSQFMNITEANQFLYVTAQLKLHSLSEIKQYLPPIYNEVTEKWTIEYGLKVNKLDETGKPTEVAWPLKNHTITIECNIKDSDGDEEDRDEEEDEDREDPPQSSSRIRVMQSSGPSGSLEPPSSQYPHPPGPMRRLKHMECTQFTIFFEPELLVGNYEVQFELFDSVNLKKLFSSVNFEAWKIDEKFTQYVVGIRYMFFMIALIGAVAYCINFRTVPSHLRVFEQRYMVILLTGLCLFNDPFVGINLVNPTKFIVFISIFCSVTFVALLYIFWMVMFERIAKENDKRSCNTMQAWKIIFGIILWLFYLIALCSVAYRYLDDPSFHFGEEYPKLTKVCMWITAIITLIIAGYNIYYMIQCLKNWRTRIQRHKVFLIFSLFFMIVFEISILSAAHDPYNLSGPSIVLTLMIANFYVFILVWIYSYDSIAKKELDVNRNLAQSEANAQASYQVLRDSARTEDDDAATNYSQEIQRPNIRPSSVELGHLKKNAKGEMELEFDDELDTKKEKQLEELDGKYVIDEDGF